MFASVENLPDQTVRQEAIAGCLLGMAVADALGVPREGLSARRAERMFGRGGLSHHLLLGRGMISDDTEHACMTAQALLKAGDDIKLFQSSLAWRLRWWLLGMPAGIGFGTLRSILKLWIGFPPTRSGVFSAGNGPAMRAPILGVVFAQNSQKLREAVKASTIITHTDPKAEQGALAIAAAAAFSAIHDMEMESGNTALSFVEDHLTDPALLEMLQTVRFHLQNDSTPEKLAEELGLSRGVSGYIYHTVPMALFCWLRFKGDYQKSVERSIRLGGDTDTLGGIVGALVGISTGKARMPQQWLSGMWEWPRSVDWIEKLAVRVARRFSSLDPPEMVGPLKLFWPGQLLRNILFAAIVLGHGFRRLLPPYG